jgi:hypothetical protein
MFSPVFIVLEGAELRVIPAADNAASDAPFLINSLRGLFCGVMIIGIESGQFKNNLYLISTLINKFTNSKLEIRHQAKICKGSEYHKIVGKLIK